MGRHAALNLAITLALLLVLLGPAPLAAKAEPTTPLLAETPTYTVVNLGTFLPEAVNSAGQIAGSSLGQAAVWQNGVVTPLPAPGLALSVAEAINDAGEIAGFGYPDDGGSNRAIAWRDGGSSILGWARHSASMLGVRLLDSSDEAATIAKIPRPSCGRMGRRPPCRIPVPTTQSHTTSTQVARLRAK